MAIVRAGGLSNRIGSGQNGRINRAETETKIADKNKSYYDAFVRATSAPTVLCTYWSIDNSTSYSEGTKNIKLSHNAEKFIKISNFQMFNYDSEDLEDKTTDDRRISINLAAKSSFLQPGSILPKEGDHIVLASQGAIAKPYMVSKVTPLKFLDKEIWSIDYIESTKYTIPELESCTVSRKSYITSNGSTGLPALIDEDDKDLLDVANAVLDKIRTKYVELFYDVAYDDLVYVPYGQPKLRLNYYAISRLQELHQVLKYGYDKNTLFIQNTYGFDAIEENFDKSLYGSLIERWFIPRDEHCNDSPSNITNFGAEEIANACELRDRIFDEYRGFPQYESKYVYETRLYLRHKSEHLIVTRYYNSEIVLFDMFDTAGFFDPRLKKSWLNFELKSPVICPVLDMYMDQEYDKILEYCKKLKRYNPSKLCIDDYIGVPMLLICLEEAIKYKTDNKQAGTYV